MWNRIERARSLACSAVHMRTHRVHRFLLLGHTDTIIGIGNWSFSGKTVAVPLLSVYPSLSACVVLRRYNNTHMHRMAAHWYCTGLLLLLHLTFSFLFRVSFSCLVFFLLFFLLSLHPKPRLFRVHPSLQPTLEDRNRKPNRRKHVKLTPGLRLGLGLGGHQTRLCVAFICPSKDLLGYNS